MDQLLLLLQLLLPLRRTSKWMESKRSKEAILVLLLALAPLLTLDLVLMDCQWVHLPVMIPELLLVTRRYRGRRHGGRLLQQQVQLQHTEQQHTQMQEQKQEREQEQHYKQMHGQPQQQQGQEQEQ